jgi:hypothetical protein
VGVLLVDTRRRRGVDKVIVSHGLVLLCRYLNFILLK